MKRIWFCLISILMLVACSDEIPQEHPEKSQTRTMLAYLVANNAGYNLDKHLKQNVVDMYSGLAAHNEAAALLVYYRPNTFDEIFQEPTILKFVSDGKGHINGQKALLSSNVDIVEVYKQAEKFMFKSDQIATSPVEMKEVLQKMKELVPSVSYGLSMGSHGSGWMPGNSVEVRAFGDDHGYSIDIPVLADVLSSVFTKEQLEFVLFDACMMSDAEVFYELRDVTNYCIASVMETPVDGFPYKEIMADFYSKEVNYKNICDEFIAHNLESKSAGWGTVAAVDCSKMQPIADWVKNGLKSARGNFADDFYKKVQQYGSGSFKYFSFDIVDFFRQLGGDEPQELQRLMDQAVIAKKCLSGNEHSFGQVVVEETRYCGMGMYIPYYPEKTKMNKDTDWDGYYESSIEWCKVVGWTNYRP